MNIEIVSELFLMNKMQNEPITYEGKDKKRVVRETAEAMIKSPTWLDIVLGWVNASSQRIGRVLPLAVIDRSRRFRLR